MTDAQIRDTLTLLIAGQMNLQGHLLALRRALVEKGVFSQAEIEYLESQVQAEMNDPQNHPKIFEKAPKKPVD